MTQERKFQIQLADTFEATDIQLFCIRCRTKISMLEDPEHVAMFSALRADSWRMHIDCFEEVLTGMIEFHRIFIIEKQKGRVLQ